MPYLIDGHNLISKLPDIDLSDNHDEAELVFKLRGFSARKRKKCIVIFDEGLPGGRSALSTHSVLVIFAASQRTNADNVIRERINETPDPGNWTVISSDNEVLASAKSRGMKGMKCRDFAKILLTPARPTPEAGTETHIQLSGDEVTQWMSEFEMIDPETLPEPEKPQQPRARRQATQHTATETPNTPLEKASDPKKRPVQPRVHPNMKTSDDHYLTRNDVETWQQLFDDGTDKPLPPLDKPREGIFNYTEDGKVVRRRPEKNRHRKQNRENIVPEMKYDEDLYLSQEDIDEWLHMFGDEDE